ncbi:unnamed protein product [Rhodiola kirilowii]
MPDRPNGPKIQFPLGFEKNAKKEKRHEKEERQSPLENLPFVDQIVGGARYTTQGNRLKSRRLRIEEEQHHHLHQGCDSSS